MTRKRNHEVKIDRGNLLERGQMARLIEKGEGVILES
jgi:hypothetical protein